ncbi:MFS transporter [Legionella micdadei]|uniref:Lysosomal dipeptide transporter MFSD1 n=1 Tax=Legionella micdadei TaxID=451 RepID=A0A098GB71_LEGMI|nr:MFS transporter [Legionella micdadei]ARG99260.1 MFS transporter [Legionella micdadei]KTD27829.1 major facilitator family transporter [Legionella micdadei]NSL19569.1 MFS transporter [Legionella micdadei]CEG59734.1 Major facilitator family transporter [Legionella micdadei]SCY78466.1 Predicted arabinose efflux permease, MFS family [Legionella micdadei]
MRMVEEYKTSEQVENFLLPWLVCFSASLFFFYEFIQGNMFASIADNIMQDFHVQADKMAYLSSIYYVSNVIFLFVAGFVLDRFSAKKTILIAMLLCVLSTFILAQAQSFYLALFCRFMTGIGSAFCFLGPIRLASRWFPPQRMALVTGVIVTIAMTGGMIAQYPLTKLVAQIGWREALVQVGWLGTIMLVVMYFGIIDRAQGKNQSAVKRISLLATAKKAYLNPQTLRAALYTSLMNMAIAVYGAMMGSLYLMQKMGVSKEDAAVVNSMLFLGAIIGGPIIGWCSDKLGLRILPMKVGVLASLLTMLSILFVPVSLPVMKVLFFLLGFFTAAQVISYALVAESSSPMMTASAVSVVSILTQGGCVVYQVLFSFLLMQHGEMRMLGGVPVYSLGDYQYAALIFPIGLIVALLVLFGLRETYCRHAQAEE